MENKPAGMQNNNININIPNPEQQNQPKGSKKALLVGVLFIILGIVAAKACFTYLMPIINKNPDLFKQFKFSSPVKAKTTVTKTMPPKQPQPIVAQAGSTINNMLAGSKKPKQPSVNTSGFLLNGIFFSEVEAKGTALINNKIVEEGDTVDGAKVVKIDLEEVELEFEGQIIKLINR